MLLQEFQMSRNLCVHHVCYIAQKYHNLDDGEGCLPKNREKHSLLNCEENKGTICIYQAGTSQLSNDLNRLGLPSTSIVLYRVVATLFVC